MAGHRLRNHDLHCLLALDVQTSRAYSCIFDILKGLTETNTVMYYILVLVHRLGKQASLFS